MTRTDVIVVGAGPTGLMLANELAIGGIDVVVLEKSTTRGKLSRAGSIQPRTAEILESRGLLQPMLAQLPDAQPELGAHFGGLPVALDCTPWQTRFKHPVTLPQAVLEQYLEQQLTDRGIPVLRGHEVQQVEQADHHVCVDDFQAKYLVACDGAHSTVRRLLDLPFPGQAATMRSVVADITLTRMLHAADQDGGEFSRLVRAGNGYFTVLAPLGDGLYRLIFGKTTGEYLETEIPVSYEEVADALKAVYGSEIELGELRAASRFGNAARQLEQYQTGRIVFAGDAAHIHMPIGGQGVNVGIGDAFNLGWKLAATIRGDAPEGLLSTYHHERHPVAERVLRHTRAQSVILNPGQDPEIATVREVMIELLQVPGANRLIAGMISGLDIEYPTAGPRAIDREIATSNGIARLSEFMHEGHGLFISPSDRQIDLTAWNNIDAVIVDDDHAMLIRPDGHIAWTDATGETVEVALARWFGSH